MASTSDYRLVVRSDGDALLVTVEGGIDPSAGRHVREVAAVAAKLGIRVRFEHAAAIDSSSGRDRR